MRAQPKEIHRQRKAKTDLLIPSLIALRWFAHGYGADAAQLHNKTLGAARL